MYAHQDRFRDLVVSQRGSLLDDIYREHIDAVKIAVESFISKKYYYSY